MSDNDEVVASRPRRKMKPRSKWNIHTRPGKGALLTEVELARALGEMPRTIRNWRYRGLLPFVKCGHRSIRFRLDMVLEALEKRTIKRRHFYEQRI